jgi:hypothetical protein
MVKRQQCQRHELHVLLCNGKADDRQAQQDATEHVTQEDHESAEYEENKVTEQRHGDYCATVVALTLICYLGGSCLKRQIEMKLCALLFLAYDADFARMRLKNSPGDRKP